LNSLKTNAEFAYPIAKQVAFGPAQFVAHLPQSLQPDIALVLRFRW
jgi:hypothetical protein